MKKLLIWLIPILFVTGIFGAWASLTVGAFKIHPIVGCFVVSVELIIVASILCDIEDK